MSDDTDLGEANQVVRQRQFMDGGGGSPKTDPTALTTDRLNREITLVKVQFETEIKNRGVLSDEKFIAVDARLGRAIDALDSLMNEKFTAANERFETSESLRIEQKSDRKSELDAALSAAKEAVGAQTEASERSIAKSEAATNKQLEQLKATIDAAFVGTNTVLTDVKERLTRIESIKTGGDQKTAGLYAAIGAAVAIMSIMLSIAVMVLKK